MGHEIDQTVNAKGAFIAAREPGWHGLGEVKPEWTMEQILAYPGMSYRVGLDGITTEYGHRAISDQKATVRLDTLAPLAVVGDRYRVLQHTDEFKHFDEVLTPAGYTYETAGILRGGRNVFLLAKRPEGVMIADGDKVRQFLALFFSYDSKSATQIKTCAMRVVCANTQRIALDETGATLDHAVKHTASQSSRMQQIRDQIERSSLAFDTFVSDARMLAAVKADPTSTREAMALALEAAFGKDDDDKGVQKRKSLAIEGIKAAFQSPEQSVGGILGTKWSVYNAISQWADHALALGVKGTTRAKAERRFMSVISGKADEVKQAAWERLLLAA